MAGPDFSALEQQYALPPGFLAAQQQVESGGRDVTSSAGAMGRAQLMPATARSLGVNPHDPMQAAEGQARLMRANLDATGGDVDRAAMMYHGGPDTRQWGPKTHAYPGKILAALQGTQAPAPAPNAPAAAPDPFDSALSGHSGTTSQDPFEAALSGGKAPPDAVIPDRTDSTAPVHPGNSGGATAVSSGVVPVRQVAPDQMAGQAEGSGQDGFLTSAAKGIADFGSGISEGYDKFQTGLVGLGLRATDAVGLTSGMHEGLNKFNADNAHYRDDEFYNPDGYARPVGKFVGESIPLAPLSEIKAISVAPDAGRLAQGLAKYANFSGQGIVGGALSSGGDNIVRNAAIGAGLAPVAGAALEKAIIPAAMGAARLAGRGVSKLVPDGASDALAAGLAKARGEGGAVAGEPMPAPIQIIRKGDGTETRIYHTQTEPGLTGEVTDDSSAAPSAPIGNAPAPLDPAAVQQAMGSRGNNVGVEGSPDLPQAVHDHAAMLAQDGIPLDQALREARLQAIGAQPTHANVTRDPAALRAEVEGSKVDTIEGQALAAQRASNNGVVVNKMAETASGFSPTGNVPQSSEATQAAADALAKASDAGRAKVNQAYTAARTADPEALIEPNNIHSLLNSDEAKAVPASTPEGALLAQVRNTVEQGQLAHDSQIMPTGVSPDALNNIGTMANRKFGADKAVNYWVGKISDAGDKDLSQIDSLGEAWRNARQTHASWAREFQDPAGVRNLISRDPQGNFLNANAGAKNDNLWTASDSTPAVQIIKALKNNGADDATNLIKSHIAQQAYEAATGKSGGNAVDQAGNSPVSGKAYHAFLNKVGGAKLKALYTPEELANMTNLGHAANIINETPAGVNNSSNTSSALANAISAAQRAAQPGKASTAMVKGMPIIGAIAGHLTGAGAEAGGMAGLVTEPIAKALANTMQRRAQAQADQILADHLNLAGSPSAMRTAANENAIQEATAQQRKALTANLARAIAAPASTRKGQR